MARLKKLSASSLVEVIVAMVIFILLLSLSLTMIVRLSASGFTAKKLKCEMLVADYAFKAKKEKSFFDESISRDGIDFTKRVTTYQKDLIFLELFAVMPGGDTLSTYKELIYAPN